MLTNQEDIKMKTLTKSEYEEMKNSIIFDNSLTVSTKIKTNRKKLEHKTTISSELGTLILEISNAGTVYLFKESTK